jgi:spermidine synthase
MQKHIRTGIGNVSRIKTGRRMYTEALNPYFGYFYTIKETLRKEKTKYQELELVDTDEFGKVLLLDNITQVAERNDYEYHEAMVHPAMCSHPDPETVLIIGGGDGGILREVLKYPCVKSVEIAELDSGVVEFSKKYLTAVHNGCFDDERVKITIADGRLFTQKCKKLFDVVIMDMTDPFGPSKMLYTKEFFKIVKQSFCDSQGIFVMHSESPVTRPKAFGCIQKTLNSVFANVNPLYLYIQMYAVLWSITLSSDTIDFLKIKPSLIDKRLSKYKVKDLRVYCGATHHSMMVEFPYIQQILKSPARIITDKKPDFPDDFISC